MTRRLLPLFLLSPFPLALFGHHSVVTHFDTRSIIEIEGELGDAGSAREPRSNLER